jgi:hypothetical protein
MNTSTPFNGWSRNNITVAAGRMGTITGSKSGVLMIA